MLSSFSPCWTHVYFSIPQDTQQAKRDGRRFIRALKSLAPGAGWSIVISRGRGSALICSRIDRVQAVLFPMLPADGEIRLVPVTDKQVEISRMGWGKFRKIGETVAPVGVDA